MDDHPYQHEDQVVAQENIVPCFQVDTVDVVAGRVDMGAASLAAMHGDVDLDLV